MKTYALALLFPLAAAGACDDSGGGGGVVADTSVQENDTSAPADTTPSGGDTTTTAAPDSTEPQPDTTTPTPDTVTPGACSREGFTSSLQAYNKGQGTLVVEMRSGSGTPVDILQIEIYTSGQFAGASGEGTYSLAGSTYEDCSNCVLVRTNCSSSGCDKRFLVDEGDLVIEQWDLAGGRFKGHLADAKAKEVTIDSDTYVSTLVPGGQTWCLDGVTFDAEVPTLPVSNRTQDSCVGEGTGTILGDNIANFSLTNCAGGRVKLHSDCGSTEKKALWLIGTTGWCTACHEFLEDYADRHGGSLSRAIVAGQTPGLDMLIVLGEDNYGGKPTLEYCQAYAEDLNLDPAMVVIDWSDTPVPLPVVNAPGTMIQTNSLATLWSNIDPYLYEEGGSVSTYYPWWAILRPRNMEYVWSDRAALHGFEFTLLTLLSE